MIAPKLPDNEYERQKAVEKYMLLDTLSEEKYDDITRLASYICDSPISLITLLDKERNFLKSHHGIPFNESPRAISFCGHAINSNSDITIVEDARKDERFHDNPLVAEHNAIFYAGAPLVDASGFKLGTLCVYDVKPRKLTKNQIDALLSMSKQVVHLFEQRYQNHLLKKAQDSLQQRNENLKSFAGIVSHDLKSPLANIISLTQLLEDDNQGNLNDESKLYIEYLKSSSNTLKDYIDGLLEFYKSDEISKSNKETISFDALISELKLIIDPENTIELINTSSINCITANKSAVLQVLVNLATNAIKYNSKEKVTIEIDLKQDENFHFITVKDNGDGIDKAHMDTIFDLFSVASLADKYGKRGTGIGLATVKKIVQNLGGEINVSSQSNVGTSFKFSISKN